MNSSFFRWLGWAAMGLGGLVLGGAFALACTYVYLAPSLPTAESMHSVELEVPLRVYSRSGGLISQIGEQRRIPIRFDDIPLVVRQAVLAAEDDRFFDHSGLEWKGIVRATLANVATAQAGQGGSTITQQTARNMFLTLDKTLRRKLSEVFLTFRMERDFTKEQIFATYLNVIFFGQRSYGIAAAAETFYGRRLDELSVAQAATLAGIIQLPSRYNPVTSPSGAEMRRRYVLGRMLRLGYIDEATAAEAAQEPVASRGFAPLYDVEAPYAAELARLEIVSRFGESAVNAGYKVFTTLDDMRQTAANRALRLGLMEYDRRHGYRGHLGHVELPAAPTDTDLEQELAAYQSVSILLPAVVTSVADTRAEIHIRQVGKARIAWDGLSWARPVVRGGLGASPRRAADVVKRGDVILVVTDRRGNAQLAQLPAAQAALVALDPQDGAIVSMVGGFDYYTNQFNRVTQARRQPGSGFKPFIYSAALDNGYTPATLELNTPVVTDFSNSEERWRPENSGGEFGGQVPLRDALVRSLNLVSIRVLQRIGVETAIDHAAKFGFRRESLPPYLTLSLGTQVTTPLEMATGFAVFANGGFKVDPYLIQRIEDSQGNVVFEAQPKLACIACETRAGMAVPAPHELLVPEETGADTAEAAVVVRGIVDGSGNVPPPVAYPLRIFEADAPAELRELARQQGGPGLLPPERLAPRVLSAQNAWLMSDILNQATVRGTAQRVNQLGRNDLAGKTGTSQNSRDNWFNGYNNRIVTSVWVGFDEERSLGANEFGNTTAVPIWMHYMREALRNVPSSRLERPEGLMDLRVSRVTGAMASPLDPDAVVDTFMWNALPPGAAMGDDGALVMPSETAPPAPGNAAPLF